MSQAIAQMEKVTQTTAATAEESAAASEELTAQAEDAMGAIRQLEAVIGGSTGRVAGASGANRALDIFASVAPRPRAAMRVMPARREIHNPDAQGAF